MKQHGIEINRKTSKYIADMLLAKPAGDNPQVYLGNHVLFNGKLRPGSEGCKVPADINEPLLKKLDMRSICQRDRPNRKQLWDELTELRLRLEGAKELPNDTR